MGKKLTYCNVYVPSNETANKTRAHQNYSVLYQLMAEREPYMNISHLAMPTWNSHVNYIKSKPYIYWFVVYDENEPVGAYYISKNWEIGLFILKSHQRKGYGKNILNWIKAMHKGAKLANIAPDNHASISFFREAGFKEIQRTFKLS